MRLLILGGTLFLGRHLVQAALAHGHRVTTFTRGLTNPGIFPQVEVLHGDRDMDLTALRGRRWDAVIDTSAYLPRQVEAAVAALSGSVDRYCFISSVSVYSGFPTEYVSEASALHRPLEDPAATVRRDTYGPLKVACEQVVLRAFGDTAFIVRPGVLVGPWDPTDRLLYWTRRVAEGGVVLAPGNPAHPIQLLDARDLAEWIVGRLERAQTGIFNAAGPDSPLSMGSLLDACSSVSGTAASFCWAPDEFLLTQGLRPWADIPLWLPSDAPGMTDYRAARSLGFCTRPFTETVGDVFADATNTAMAGSAPVRPTSISREREKELLHRLRRPTDVESCWTG